LVTIQTTHCKITATPLFVRQRRLEAVYVNFSSIGRTPTPTPIKVDGRKFLVFIVTGVDVSDVSLMSDGFAEIFSSKLKPHHVATAGITSGNIFSKYHFQADEIGNNKKDRSHDS
jgi:hypothetical protein